jgi:hypothetical protein
MQVEKLRSLIRESIQEYIKEIDGAAEDAAMEARIAKCEEAIQMRETKLAAIDESEHRDLIDGDKVKALENEIKELKKAKAKFEKAKEKKANKKAGKDKKDEVVTDAKIEETPVDETDVMEKMDVTDEGMKEEALNESFLKMQKLAGVITETQYNQKKKVLVESQVDEGLIDKIKEKIQGIKDIFNMRIVTSKEILNSYVEKKRITPEQAKKILDSKEIRAKLKNIAGVGPLSSRPGSNIDAQIRDFESAVSRVIYPSIEAAIKANDEANDTRTPEQKKAAAEAYAIMKAEWDEYCRGGRC